MNLAPALTAEKAGGLFELDAEGTIVYSRLRKNDLLETEPGAVGCNFFDEVAAFENVDDFRRRFRFFVKGSAPMENFNFDFLLEKSHRPMRVRLVRVSEHGDQTHKHLVIVDIRNV